MNLKLLVLIYMLGLYGCSTQKLNDEPSNESNKDKTINPQSQRDGTTSDGQKIVDKEVPVKQTNPIYSEDPYKNPGADQPDTSSPPINPNPPDTSQPPGDSNPQDDVVDDPVQDDPMPDDDMTADPPSDPDPMDPLVCQQYGISQKHAAGQAKIFMSFDDGPEMGTKEVAEVVANQGVKVTYFLVAKYLEAVEQWWPPSYGETMSRIDIARMLEAQGHLIGNHTYSHFVSEQTNWSCDYSDTAPGFGPVSNLINDITGKANTLFSSILKPATVTNGTKKFVRLPCHNTWRTNSGFTQNDSLAQANSIPLADQLKMQGYQLFGWDVEWRQGASYGAAEWWQYNPSQSAQQLYQEIENSLVFNNSIASKKGKVVMLTHDRLFAGNGKLMLTELIQRLKCRGYEFKTLDQY